MAFPRISFARFLVPVLAVAGLVVMGYTVVAGEKAYPVAPPLSVPSSSPFPYTVAGAGLVEASSENIAVGSPLAGTVERVHVRVGEKVAKGAPLFTLDERQVRADLATREAALALAEQRLPEAEAMAAEANFQLEQVRGLEDNRAVSREEVRRRETAAATARARVASARAAIVQARAEANAGRTELDRLTVRAPIAGEVLQLNARSGEFLTYAAPRPPVVLGETSVLHIRADIDENDAWRVRPGAKAVGNLRGNADIRVDLTWVRAEPLVMPKRSLTGESTERVDTRVLQVLFAFSRGQQPIYVGQQMDVFIAAPAPTAKASAPAVKPAGSGS